jgi:hypothetical protein
MMTLKRILKDYLQIIQTTAYSKQAKKEHHQKFQVWLQERYDEMPTYTELNSFIADLKLQGLAYDTWFFLLKVFFPIYDKEILNNNLAAIKQVLFFYSGPYGHFKNDHTINLLQLGLKIDAEDLELLKYHLDVMDRCYANTIHEVPSGVLYDHNGASIEQAQEMLNDLTDYEKLSCKLNQDRSKLIAECRFYYTRWISYLSNQAHYASFEACINELA